MHIDVITRTDEFYALRDEWAALVANASDHLYLSHAYLATWWKHLSGSAGLRVAVIRDGGRLIAAAPMMLRWGTLLKWPVRRLEFIGAGWGYGGFVVAEQNAECMSRIMAALGKLRGWDVIALSNVLGDPTIDAGATRTVHEHVRAAVPCIPLDTTWDSYLAERSPSFRRNIRNRAKKLESAGAIRVQRIRRFDDTGVRTVMHSLRTVASRSWKARNRTAISSSAAVFAFYTELAERLEQSGALDISILWVGDEPAAYIFGASHRGEFFEIDIAFDASLAKTSPGVYLRNALLRELFAQQYVRYDFMSYFDYKRELTSHVRELDSHVLYRRTAYPLILKSLRSVVRNTMPRVMTDYSDLSWGRGREADAGV